SVMLVVYGSMAGLSVGQLYAAAMAPGLLLAGLYIVYIFIRCAIRPNDGPPMPREERTYSVGQQISLFFTSLFPIMALVFVVLGSIVLAIATPTEAAGLGCAGAFILAALYRKLTWKAVYDAAISTLKTTCMVMTLFLGGNAFQSVFLGLGGGDAISGLLLGMELNRYVVLFIMMGILFFLGMFIDWLGILLITLPIFIPIATELDFHPLWFATLVCVNLQMAFLTPPFGYSLFYLRGIAPPEMTIQSIYKGVTPFIALQWVGLSLCIAFPEIVMIIPKFFFGAELVK
ncbi:MAG: TRAP transporter large permease subunit, partial [Pseudomonadota bacterium]